MKTTSNGKRPQNILIGISQQPLIGSSATFKLKIWEPDHNKKLLKMKTTLNGRRPQNIKSGTVELKSRDQTKIVNCC
jgi:hypothetical protein